MTVIMSQTSSSGRRRVCNGTCHRAKKPTCACICNGQFHGATERLGHAPTSIEDAMGLPALTGEQAIQAFAIAAGVLPA